MNVIVDYGRGNIFSIVQSIKHLGRDCEVTRDPDKILNAEKLILPGVGAFGAGMHNLTQLGLINPILTTAKKGTPLLGICLGMQMLADYSEEFGTHSGLGLIGGAVKRLPDWDEQTKDKTRIPNVGWCQLSLSPKVKKSFSMPDPSWFYFVHSFAFQPDNARAVLATVPVNGVNIAAVVRSRNVVGCQFHPEKSGDYGLNFLRWFVDLNSEN